MPKHQRLRTARLRAGFKTARDAATKLGIPYGTYSGHESGSRGIKDEEAKKYADFFGVSASWITFGQDEETPKTHNFMIINGVAGRKSDGEVEFFRNEQIELMPVNIAADITDREGRIIGQSKSMPTPFFMAPSIDAFMSTICIKVEGDKLKKYWESSSVLYFHKERFEDLEGFKRVDCLCWTDDGGAIVSKPFSSTIFGKNIVAVSPLLLHLTHTGQTMWFESLAAAFMRAAHAVGGTSAE